MKKTYPIGLSLFVVMLCISGVAHAATSYQCSINRPVNANGETFTQCPSSTKNNSLIEQGYNGARLEPSTTISQTAIWVHSVCRYVDAFSMANPLFIPFNSAVEWSSFLTHKPAEVHLANCCLPRTMRVSDIAKPTVACTNGTWVLEGLVDYNDHSKRLAKPASMAANAELVMLNNETNNTDYPIIDLPINRDDQNVVLPNATQADEKYVGHYSCGSQLDYYTLFQMQCANADWRNLNITTENVVTETSTEVTTEVTSGTTTTSHALPAPVVSAPVISVTSEIAVTTPLVTTPLTTPLVTTVQAGCTLSSVLTRTKPCPLGGGTIVTNKLFNSCTKQFELEVYDNCTGIVGCFDADEIQTTACNNGSGGNLVQRFQHICDGSDAGRGRDQYTMISNGCAG